MRLRLIAVPAALCIAVAACAPVRQPPDARAVAAAARSPLAATGVGGAYEFVACRTACTLGDSAAAYVRGTINLLPDPDAAANLDYRRRHKNGCYRLREIRPLPDSYLGLVRAGPISWASDSTGIIHFQLYNSPDAAYHVSVRIVDGAMRGSGGSSGAGVAAIEAPSDSIVGRRAGPVDPTVCEIS